MIERRFSYSALQRNVTKQLFRHFLFHGPGGPLVLLWSVGTGLFLFLLGLPVYALVWNGAIIALGIGMVAFYLGDRKVHELLLRSTIERRSLVQNLADASLQRDVQKGIEGFVEITLRIGEIEKVHGRELNLQRVLSNAYSMLWLQLELTRQAEELDRGENTVLSQERAVQAHSLAGETLAQLDTLAMVLQVLRPIDRSRDAIVLTTELAREAEETLWKLRAKADSLREGAGVIDMSPPADSGTPGTPVLPVNDDVVQRLADRYAPAELKQLREALSIGFSRIQSEDGFKALRGLVYEYAQLRAMLARWKKTDLLTVARIPPLAEEAYRQGLSVLEDALELIQAVSGPERERLGAETAELEREIETLKGDETQAGRVTLMQENLTSNQELLNMIKQQLNQCGRCEASLNRTRLELAGLKADRAELSVDEVTQALRRDIDLAKEIQAELKKPGW